MTNKEIALVCLQHRRNYSDLFTYLLDKIKPKNKELIKLYYLTTGPVEIINNYKSTIEHEIVQFSHFNAFPGSPYEHINNYGHKINFAADINCEYIMKFDEDVFVNPQTIDCMIENRVLLDNNKYIAIAPITNIGVPTCEWFIKDFCTEIEKEEIYKLFLSTDMNIVAQRWNMPELSQLNKHTLEAKYWDFENFINSVNNLNTEKKGIHPVRFNGEAQKYLCNLVVNNIERFLENKKLYLFKTNTNIPHLCNEVSFHKQSVFNEIRNEFQFNPYEEIPINQYKRKYNKEFLFVSNGFCYTDIFAFVSRCNPNLFDEMNKQDYNLYQKLLNNCKEYYKGHY